MGLFLDSSFLISLIVETQFTEKAKKLLETHIDEDFYTSITVIEETLYVLRRLLKETKRENISRIKLVLDELDVSVLEELSMSDFLDVYSNYDLLPNDALIAATCKHYGIKKIATFDENLLQKFRVTNILNPYQQLYICKRISFPISRGSKKCSKFSILK